MRKSVWKRFVVTACLSLPCSFGATVCSAQSAPVAGPEVQRLQKSVQAGVTFLKTSQDEGGYWTTNAGLGITALATYSLLLSDVPVNDPAVQKGLGFLVKHAQSDGGIYMPESKHKNYETSLAVLALCHANADGRYQKQIDEAVAFLKELQWDEKEIGDRSHTSFGGAGYGNHSRPDMSNTTFFLEALQAAGVSSHDASVQNALTFISRCQNLKSEHNTTEHADKVQDGGFYYTVANGGSSMAGAEPDGGLRSYGSMTYAGLKSMIYAGLSPEDQRVKAAQEWIQKHYVLTENPGMGQQGLFYYYQMFAKALDTVGSETVTDAQQRQHDWRKDLANQLFSSQKSNGSWVNENPRWLEGDPNLVTAYALISLARCEAPKKAAKPAQ